MNKNLKSFYNKINIFTKDNAKLPSIKSINEQIIDLSNNVFKEYDRHISDTNYNEKNFYILIKYNCDICMSWYTILTPNEYNKKTFDVKNLVLKDLIPNYTYHYMLKNVVI